MGIVKRVGFELGSLNSKPEAQAHGAGWTGREKLKDKVVAGASGAKEHGGATTTTHANGAATGGGGIKVK